MIVRDLGDAWQIVFQTDHGDVAGAFARAWADRGPRHDSLAVAAERHDDGWAVWEQAPMVEPATGTPVNFLDVEIPAHLAFYRAAIAAIADEDLYAGLLVSMHGAGIYRQRYGTDPALGLSRAAEVQGLVDAFVEEQEGSHAELAAAVGVDEELRWADYHRLQVYDRLCLHFCLRDAEAGAQAEITDYRLEPLGPWRVRMAPYPFAESPARFTLLRRVVPKRAWGLAEFRRALADQEPARTEITIER